MVHVGSFDRAARSYEQASYWQQQVFDKLKSFLPKGPVSALLDVGCGVAAQLQVLEELYPEAALWGLDRSSMMLEEAKKKLFKRPISFICDDFLGIPLDVTYDLIVSNAALHWSADILSLYQRFQLGLSDKGSFVFSLFLPETFEELQKLCQALGKEVRIPSASFLTAEQHIGYLKQVFSDVYVQRLELRSVFNSLKDLMLRIRYTGLQGEGGRPFWTPGFYKALEALYMERYGGIWAKASVLYGVASG
ncbi:MAG: methyltransferase domain-containing protein [bacterium]